MPHSGRHFLRFECDLMPKSLILDTPWRPAGHKMPSQIAQVAPKRYQKLLRVKQVEPTCSRDRFRKAPWHHVGRFGTDFGWICIDFSINFKAYQTYFAIRLADCQHRLTRSELTANIKNIQISAEICKEQTQIKNADTKTLIDHLQFVECNQLQQTPISKYGGGGARAAWRIRIRRPRLAERGFKACQIFTRTSADSWPQTDPALSADRTLRYPSARQLPTLGRQMSDCWLTFCRTKIYLKSDPSKNVPKPQKSDPWSPKRRFWDHFWHQFWQGFFMNFLISS